MTQVKENSLAGQLCEQFGFGSTSERAARLALVELGEADRALARLIQHRVIVPHIDAIIDGFYHMLMQQPGFLAVVNNDALLTRLRGTQRAYVLSLGVGFASGAYFEERLRVGVVHARIGVPLSLYQCAMRALQQQLIDHIDTAESMAQRASFAAFILKITALDMSLAIETYHGIHISTLEESIVSLQDRSRILQRQTEIDSGTGLANRRHILEVLEAAIAHAQREQTPLCLIMADIDRFKRINDTYGHLAGDKVLRAVAESIHSVIREFDQVGRYGGEEFLIVLPNKSNEVIKKIAARILAAVRQTVIHWGKEPDIRVTISLGVASMHAGDSLTNLIARSDVALYEAKNAGRDCIIFNI